MDNFTRLVEVFSHLANAQWDSGEQEAHAELVIYGDGTIITRYLLDSDGWESGDGGWTNPADALAALEAHHLYKAPVSASSAELEPATN